MQKMSLSFRSTRAHQPEVGLFEAIQRGLASDGGLYIPVAFPQVDFRLLPGNSFEACSRSYLTQWLGNAVESSLIESIVVDALNFDVPLVALSGDPCFDDTHILELFHGPTLSFKDFGARTMALFLGHELERGGEQTTILVATSGDTGSAVADAFSGIPGLKVFLLYPKSQVSPVQEMQLIVERDGVHALRVNGSFDDCQRLVKGAFHDERLKECGLSTANSINIARLIPQMLYYVWAARNLGSDDIHFCIPSGNLGNLTAGAFAQLSGMPVARFLAAHNSNDFFPLYLKDRNQEFKSSVQTVSNAMDVGAPSNFERLSVIWNRGDMGNILWGTTVSDESTLQSIKFLYERTGYLADPHTAVGMEAVRRFRGERKERGLFVVLATAHPAKFPEVVDSAIGIKVNQPMQLSNLQTKNTGFEEIDVDQHALAEAILA